MLGGINNDKAHGVAYAVADDAAEAYKIVRTSLDRMELGLPKEREMDKVELIAEDCDYPLCGMRLYVPYA